MATASELEREFWNRLSSERTMMLGLADGPFMPMTGQLEDERDAIWFFTSSDNELVKRLAKPQAAIATFTSKNHDFFAAVEGSLAVDNDRAVIDRLWNSYVAAWYERIRGRPSFNTAVEAWMTPADTQRYADEPDPWPKVREILRAA